MNVDKFIGMDACREAVKWLKEQKSRSQAWQDCERGDWMLWLIGKTVKTGSPRHKKLVLAACKCARLSLEYVSKGEKRPMTAIKTAEAWAKGRAALEEVRAAAHAAADATHATHAAHAAADAAHAAADAAHAAADAAVMLLMLLILLLCC